MTTIAFNVVGLPATQGSKTTGTSKNGKRYVRDSNKSLPGWRQLVMTEAQKYAPPQPLDGPIMLTLRFHLPVPKSAPKNRRLYATKRPDITKLARAVEDALSGVMWRDDSQIVDIQAGKGLAYDCPVGVFVRIIPIEASS